MSYFSKFPLVYYSVGDKTELVTDILRRNSFVSYIKNTIGVYSEYDIVDGDRPEDVSFKLYGVSTFHWLILLFNEIHDPYFEWPLSQNELLKYCENVYKQNLYSVHHYEKNGYIIGEYKEYDKENESLVWLPPTNPGPQDISIIPISMFELEDRDNERKRKIKYIDSRFIPEILTQFEKSINV